MAARTDKKDINLAEFRSGLDREGQVFPMMALDGLQRVRVCANRQGERYTSDERNLDLTGFRRHKTGRIGWRVERL
ncbi:MAG: hypothetical protein WBR29_04975 [Gammaproteobacteria bacterium]